MDNETFWTLIERSRHEEAVPAERLEWLMTTVAKLPVPEIVGFQACLEDARLPLDSWELWAAADRILGGYCSDDGFWYFQAWVIGLGRAAYEAVVADPDSLAEIRELRQLAGGPTTTGARRSGRTGRAWTTSRPRPSRSRRARTRTPSRNC